MSKGVPNNWLLKNPLTLWAKFIVDTKIRPNDFLNHGLHLAYSKPLALPVEQRKTILFPTIFYLDRGLAKQVIIAKALEMRGHRVIFMPMDLRFPRRNALYFDEHDHGFISRYYNIYTRALLKNFQFDTRPYSQFGSTKRFDEYRRQVARLDPEACRAFVHNDLPLGEMARNSVIHHFRCGTSTMNSKILDAYRDYLAIGMVWRDIMTAAVEELKPDVIFTLNGSFLDSRIHLALAQQHGIRAVTFETGFMLNSIVLAENEPTVTYPMMKQLPEGYADYTLTPKQNERLDAYLKTRSLGKEAIFDYWGKPKFDCQAIRQELGLNADEHPDMLVTNLLWDSTMIDSDIGFANQLEWIRWVIQTYQKYPERKLLIRIHPAELKPPHIESMDKVEEYLHREFHKLPANVNVIPPSSRISSFPLIEISERILVYSSTAGLESAIKGKTVFVAGKCNYRGHGFTVDIERPEELEMAIASPAENLSANKIELARKYAYFFFFGLMVQLPQMQERPTNVAGQQLGFTFHDTAELLPGKDEGLDFILDFILEKRDYRDWFIRSIQ